MRWVLCGFLLAAGGALALSLPREGSPSQQASEKQPPARPATVVPSPGGRAPVEPGRGGLRSLFNGNSLSGWRHVGGGRSRLDGTQLILENDEERRPGYLVSDLTARDFEVRFRCQIERGDSGLLFRARPHPRTPTEVQGPQVQLNRTPGAGLGGLFELHGRGWVKKPGPEVEANLLQPGDRFAVTLCARGEHVRIVVNGKTTVDTTDRAPENDFTAAGCFAWQIHGGGECRVRIESPSIVIHD